MWSIAVKSLRANLSRFVATLIAIATGVGFLTAGTMVTNSIENSLGGEVDRQFAGVATVVELRNADTELGLSRGGIPLEVADAVAAVEGVRSIAGQMTGVTRFVEEPRPPKVDEDESGPRQDGLSVRAWVADDALNPLDLDDGRAPRATGEITLDRGTAEDHRLGVGDLVEMASGLGAVPARVVGITSFGTTDSPDLSGTVSAAEPWVFTLGAVDPPAWSEVLVASDGSVGDAELTRRVAEVLPDGLRARTGAQFREQQKGQTAEILGLLRPVLQGFSLLAMFVCGFVIYNTFSVVVGQRVRELALMRAVAATPRQVRRSLRVEGLLVGLTGSVLGLGLGVLITLLLSAVLQALDLDLPAARIALTPGIVITGLLIGTVVTFVSVLIPAFRAGRTAPVEAMRDAALEPTTVSRARVITSLVLLAVGVGLLLTGNGWLVGPGALLYVLSVFAIAPVLVLLAARGTRRGLAALGPVGRLASDNVGRNPKRTATTMNALVIGLLLVALVTAAGSTLKRATVDEVNKFSTADFLIGAVTGSIEGDLLDRIERIDGVRSMARYATLAVRADGQPLSIAAADLDELKAVGYEADSGSLDDLGEDGVAVVDLGRDPLGSTKTFVDVSGRRIELKVKALMPFSIELFNLALVSPETLERLSPGAEETGAFLKVDPERRKQIGKELDRLTLGFGNVQVIEGNLIGQLIGTVFDFLINAVNGLLGMSIVIALIGIVNTLTLSVFERRRELGLLRAVGMTARGVRRMVRLEALQMAILGTVVGLVAGILLAWLLLRSTDLGGMEMQWGRFGILLGLGVLLGVLASIPPTRRVTKLQVLDAISVE